MWQGNTALTQMSCMTSTAHDKHEHATCTCQIVTAQIADAGQLQDNESHPFCRRRSPLPAAFARMAMCEYIH